MISTKKRPGKIPGLFNKFSCVEKARELSPD